MNNPIDSIVIWHSPSDKLPIKGRALIVEGVVRYGKKKQMMAAKLMIDCADVSYWVALKEGSQYTETIRLRDVIKWRYAI